jgi:hypothetical protein
VSDRKEMVQVDFRFLKTLSFTLGFILLLTGCAFYVRGDDEHEHRHWHHRSYWDRALQQAPQSDSLMAAIPDTAWANHGDLKR